MRYIWSNTLGDLKELSTGGELIWHNLDTSHCKQIYPFYLLTCSVYCTVIESSF